MRAIQRIGRPLALTAAVAIALTATVRVSPGPERTVSVGFVAQAAAFDPVGYVWDKFRDGVLNKVVDFIKSPIESAKKGLQALIDKALAGLQKIFESEVIIPALIWAIPKIFPDADKF